MNKEESLALYAQGRDAWNAWAKEMLDAREKLGAWNQATLDWHEAAAVDFAGHTFDEPADFHCLIFPGIAGFGGVTFKANAGFGGATFKGDARFDGATFSDFAGLNRATFKGNAGFSFATFSGTAEFEGATFLDNAGFVGATFKGDTLFSATFWANAVFQKAIFSRSVVFSAATFRGNAWFSAATFSGSAWFKRAIFLGTARFGEAKFERFTSFDNASFEANTRFDAIEAKSAFSLAGTTFLAVPDFIQAHFAEAPRLDEIRIEPHLSQRGLCPAIKTNLGIAKKLTRVEPRVRRRFLTARWRRTKAWFTKKRTGDRERAARWRALKRLAIQGHDHAREQEFFKGELLARRRSEGTIWNQVSLVGLVYQVLSDFGGSILRPLAWWLTSNVGFAGLYLFLRPDGVEPLPAGVCGTGWLSPLWDALLLSFHKGLLGFGQMPTAKLNEMYTCLYGSPVPPNSVTAWGFVQYPWSAALIFLLLLAIRNHFRIK